MEKEKIIWENMSNSNIRIKLESLRHEHESIKTKIDELPELINVLKGDMSIVGPRPEVAKYVSLYQEDFAAVLRVRPGLSDYASIKYRNEENLLACQSDPEYCYLSVVLPDKIRLAKSYAENVSFKTDLHIIRETIRSILFSGKCYY